MQHFSPGEVVALTGVPLRTLIHWAEAGVLGDDLASARGKGNRRSFTRSQVFLVLVGKSLAAYGLLVPKLRGCLRSLDGYLTDDPKQDREIGRLGFPTEMHLADATYLYFGGPNGGHQAAVYELKEDGSVEPSRFSVSEVRQRADAVLTVRLDRRARLLAELPKGR